MLAALRRAGAPYELSPGRLLRATLVTSGTMTNRVDRLADRGFVERHPDPDDRRGVIVRLTREGKAAVDGAFTALIEAEKALLAELPGPEQKELAGLLRRLLAPFGALAAYSSSLGDLEPLQLERVPLGGDLLRARRSSSASRS